MVCVHVSLLLKRNFGVLFEVLRSTRSDSPFLACHGSAIILWILYMYIPHYISASKHSKKETTKRHNYTGRNA
jgi:hypothetical protein